jgi:hypothetical protein
MFGGGALAREPWIDSNDHFSCRQQVIVTAVQTASEASLWSRWLATKAKQPMPSDSLNYVKRVPSENRESPVFTRPPGEWNAKTSHNWDLCITLQNGQKS